MTPCTHVNLTYEAVRKTVISLGCYIAESQLPAVDANYDGYYFSIYFGGTNAAVLPPGAFVQVQVKLCSTATSSASAIKRPRQCSGP
jgi:hypothetical protein